MIHLYIGNGKGKTTAAAGLAVRAAGHGAKVLFVQFLKNGSSGEIAVLNKFTEVKYSRGNNKFLYEMNESEKQQVQTDIVNILSNIDVSAYNLIVMDEVLDCITEKLISENDISKFFQTETEIVLTGRNASDELREKADYISEIVNIKHPYNKGIKARKGIEY